VVSLSTDSHNLLWLLFCCFLFVSEGFGLVPPLCIYFPPFFNKFFRLAAVDGGVLGCQPSWDADVSS